MPANPAKHSGRPRKTRVVFMLYPGVTRRVVTGPAQVFGSARKRQGEPARYDVVLATSNGAPIVSDTGVTLATVSLNARRVGSTCIGTFMIAEAGLLSGRRATTHRRWCDELRRLDPDIAIESDAVFVKHGPGRSSADTHLWKLQEMVAKEIVSIASEDAL